MSSLKRPQPSRIVTYSRKSSRLTYTSSAGQLKSATPETLEKGRSFWDFQDSSDEDGPVKEKSALPSITALHESSLKKKVGDGNVERLGKKVLLDRNGTSRTNTPVDAANQPTRSGNENQKKSRSEGAMTPRKSTLIARSNLKPSSTINKNPQQTTPIPATPGPTTSKSKAPDPAQSAPTTPPRASPQLSVTPTKRTYSRSASSPLSSPRSRTFQSQPTLSTPVPRKAVRISTRSRTFNEFSSPKMTPQQEKIWESLPLTDTSPSRRRLVDKLREEASRTPERIRTPPLQVSQPTQTLKEEISRVLEYTVPVFDEPRRKEVSQSESQGTYLSRARSFLAEPSLQESLSIPGLEDLWQPGSNHDVDEEVEDVGVKSWHELKRGGEDKRLLDEMEDLLEECKSSGRLGLRRSSVLQIVEKLFNDISWRRKFKSLGLLSTFALNMADARVDPILLVLALLAIDLVPRPVPPTVSSQVLELCLAGLEEKRDLIFLLALRSTGVSKILKTELLALQTHVSKSQILPNNLTPRNLARNVLGDLAVADIRPICVFMRDFEDDERWRTLAALAGSLEKSTQGKVFTGLKDKDVEIFNPILQEGISDFETDAVIRNATLRFLRVCINLTNSSSEICESLNTDFLLSTLLTRVITADPQRYRDAEYPENAGSVDDTSSSHNEDHEKKESRFELHLLCLGLMINFVQESDKVKELVLSSPLAVDIKNVFEKLVAREESANHALGYLALLLAHLILPAKSGKAVLVGEATKCWLERLLDDFVGIHRVVQSQSQEEGERKEVEGMAGEVEKVLVLLRSQ